MTTTRSRNSWWLLVLLALYLAAPAIAEADDAGPLPDPPEQGEPWTPPESALPDFVVEAAGLLFGQGMADPRGCSYRVIEIDRDEGVSIPFGEEPPPLHGWVLPEGEGAEDASRFAVAWNGLVYPLSRIGEPADLEADVRALAASVDGQERPFGRFGFSVAGHRQLASQDEPSALKVCLLLRIGRADLAEALFAALTGRTPDRDRPAVDLTNYGVSYVTLANDWAWARFDRAAGSHARGLDRLALADLRALADARDRIDAQAEAMGFPRPREAYLVDPSYLSFLGPLPGLLADQERRHTEGPRPSLDEIAAIEDRPERIAALVRALDEIALNAHFISNGMASFHTIGAPIVEALVAEGFEAVEALADALERDDRLTRTIDRTSRSPSRTLTVLPVFSIAFDAIVAILGTRDFGVDVRFNRYDRPTADERLALADAIRAYARRFVDLPPEERWYRILADDSATPSQHHEAADQLVRLRDGRQQPGPVPDHAEPSVSDLIAHRIRELDPVSLRRRPDGTIEPAIGAGPGDRAAEANRLARILIRWDAEASPPILAERSARCLALLRGDLRSSYRSDGFVNDLAWLTLARIDLGELTALDDLAALLAELAPDRFDSFPHALFEPIWLHPDHPGITALVERMYGDPGSPWLPLATPDDDPWQGRGRAQLIRSPMLGVSAFRARVLEALADPAAIGSVVADDDGAIHVRFGRSTTRPDPPDDDPDRPAPGTETDLRMADLVVALLGSVGGIPSPQQWWPEPRRDEAIAAARAFLERFGDRFAPSEWHKPADDRTSRFGPPTASIALPPLGRPATDDDLQRGLALFSLEGRGERRAVPLADRPLRARWLTLTDTPRPISRTDPETGATIQEIRYLRDGFVWQAEEVLEAGRWTRYYGFLGHSSYGAAPADEVEFPAPAGSGWVPLTDALESRVIPPGARFSGDLLVTPPTPFDGPLTIEVAVRNRIGLDRPAVAPIGPIVEDGGDGELDRPTLREGVSLALARRTVPATGAPRTEIDAVPIPALPVPRSPGEADGPDLAAGSSALLLRADLRAFFAIDEPGSYLLEIAFADLEGPDGRPARIATSFMLQPSEGPATPGR